MKEKDGEEYECYRRRKEAEQVGVGGGCERSGSITSFGGENEGVSMSVCVCVCVSSNCEQKVRGES